MARTQDTSGGNDEGYAYQKAAVGFERFRTEERKSGVAAIKGRSLFARTTGAKRVANQGADDKGDNQLLRDCRESTSQEMQSGGRSWNDKTKLGEWWENEELRRNAANAIPGCPSPNLASQGVIVVEKQTSKKVELPPRRQEIAHRSFGLGCEGHQGTGGF